MRRRNGLASPPVSRWRRRAPCIRGSKRSKKTSRQTLSLLDTIAEWCLRYTPLVACDSPDGLLLDIGGCAHLYGGEQALSPILQDGSIAQALLFRLPLPAASAPPGRRALRRAGKLCRRRGAQSFLRHCRSPRCGSTASTVAGLARVGLKRIGDIIDLPRAPLAARFGNDLLRQLDRALGREHEPLNPRLPVAPYVAEQRFAEPIAREEDVLGTVERLAGRLKVALERRGDGARRIELTLFRTDGALRRIAVGCSRPLRDAGDIRALFAERLAAIADEFDPGFGFDMARLSVVVAEPCPPEQIGIGDAEDDRRHRPAGRPSERTAGRYPRAPADRAGQSYPRDRRVRRAGADGEPIWLGGISPIPRRSRSRAAPLAAAAKAGADRGRRRSAGRPAVALPLAPRAARGDRRRRPRAHRGRLVERTRRAARDYFRVEDKSGLRFWLFRAGLYRDLTQDAAPPLVPARDLCVKVSSQVMRYLELPPLRISPSCAAPRIPRN